MVQPIDVATARALLTVARMVHAEVERAGLVIDDVPELAFATVARWCEGDATAVEVQAARAETAIGRPHYEGSRDHRKAVQLYRALAYYLTAYAGGAQGVKRRFAEEQVLAMAWMFLRRLGEPEEAAKARVEAVYAAAMVEAEEVTALRDDGG